MKLEVIRFEYYDDRTIGRLEIDGKHFCYTLEDRVRKPGEKVYGETAIPEGTYTVTLEPFRGDKTKMYPKLHDVPLFTGIFIHGGNRPEDSLGCILVAYNRQGEKEIQGAAHRDLARIIEKNSPIEITVRNGG